MNNKNVLKAVLKFIENDYKLDPDDWEVGDLLSAISMPIFLFNTDSPTQDPAYWYDWKKLVKEELAKERLIIDETNGLTLEQGLVAMQYFLEKRYWIKNNDLLLKDAYNDLVQEFNKNKDNLEVSPLWQEWTKAVTEAKKFNKTFVEQYI